MSRVDRLQTRIEPLRTSLLEHELYQRMRRVEDLQLFMEHHVFAVWDFMSLLKFLQQRLCSVAVPWVPGTDSRSCRLVNEIVLGEESDEDGHGGYASHFELYLDAMDQCGARMSAIQTLIESLRSGESVRDALRMAEVPTSVQRFVLQTFEIIESKDLSATASAFTFGREDLLPGVFRRIVDQLNAETQGQLSTFRYYLDRHIELDSDDHGPMAIRLLNDLCGDDDASWQRAEDAAVAALQSRLDLWDAISQQIPDRDTSAM